MASITPRGVVVSVALALLAASFGMAAFIGFEGVAQTDQGFTQVIVTLPVGSSLQRADDKMRQVEAVVRELPEVKMISTSIGSNGKGNLNIALKPRSERRRNQFQVQDDLRERLARIPGIEVALGWNRPLYVAVRGPSLPCWTASLKTCPNALEPSRASPTWKPQSSRDCPRMPCVSSRMPFARSA